MGLLSATGAKTGTLVAAAMESVGIEVQADMLQFVTGEGGKLLAGLLYLIAIIGGIIMLAVGGNYRWARYLLVAPPLFFFLTQVTTPVNLAEWQHGNTNYGTESVKEAKRDVRESSGETVNAATFFHFWNTFMSKISQDLIALLNLDASGSHLDFMNKLERYMSLWLNNAITDPNLRAFIRLTLINECTEYFGMKKAVAELHISDKVRETYLARLAAMEGNPVIRVYHETDVKRNELMWWLTNKLDPPLAEGNYTCQQAWEATVAALKTQVQDTILSGFNERLGDNQEYQQVVAQIIRKMGVERDPNTEQVQLDDGTLIQAIDWVVAKSLWAEMLDRNYATEYANMEGHGAIFATMRPNGYFGYRASGSATSNAIQQFNRTEVYQSKGDYVNAALAMPHFQGVILLFLAAAYPFFAMAMLLPGRAGAVMLWMGLWAWAKLWDVGFAVVMMIDNILFALFPRGPNLAEGELKDAGKAWTRILETDPSYSAQVYYNLLATCLFAVPIITGLFVKSGASELRNIVRDGWQTYSTRLGTSLLSYARTMQAQRYMREQQEAQLRHGLQAKAAFMASEPFRKAFYLYATWQGGESAAKAMASMFEGTPLAAAGNTAAAAAAEFKNQQRNRMMAAQQATVELARYNYSTSAHAFWTSESAVAARWYTHDTSLGFPGEQLMGMHIVNGYLNQEAMMKAGVDETTKQVMGTGDQFMNWWQSRGMVPGGPARP